MLSFPNSIKFKKTWRLYQKRVLDQIQESLDDNHLHIIAPPGSGKTILGLEIARILNQPTLILSPTKTIKEQWVERFISEFFPDGTMDTPDWLSADIRQPGFMTVVTYQALHSAYSGICDFEDLDDCEETNGEKCLENQIDQIEESAVSNKVSKNSEIKVNASSEFISLLKNLKVKTVILDEAHHLRREWWVTLEKLEQELENPVIVALTATPPIDVPESEWDHYDKLCGPIDCEVSVPELVIAKDLCPHQDYIYFTVPTETEETLIREFHIAIDQFIDALYQNANFLQCLEQHPYIQEPMANVENIFENPVYVISMIVFINHIRGKVPKDILRVLGLNQKKIPKPDQQWLEILLSGCLFQDSNQFSNHQSVIKDLARELHRLGVIERRQVKLENPEVLTRLLHSSSGKLKGIMEITKKELNSMGEKLRLVILTDHILRDFFPASVNDKPSLNKIGVTTIFETIRNERINGVKMGVLSGSLIIIPTQASDKLKELLAKHHLENISFNPLPQDNGYYEVNASESDKQTIINMMTEIFNSGQINVLIGTKSLLGEGWDAPSINTLILASVVGSFMLSNQMRGRAIRTDAKEPGKTANIWHLACVEPEVIYPGYDFEVLDRRFQAFVGVSFNKNIISSGFDRMNIGKPPFSKERIDNLNDMMLKFATDRKDLEQKWDQALYTKTGIIIQTVDSHVSQLPRHIVLENTLRALCYQGLTLGGIWFTQILRGALRSIRKDLTMGQFVTILGIACVIGAIIAAPNLLKALWLFVRHGSLESSMQQVGEALLQSLIDGKIIKRDPNLRVKADMWRDGVISCYLRGGDVYTQKIFLKALQDILNPIDNPRFILVRKSLLFNKIQRIDYHSVPQVLCSKKSNAYLFEKMWLQYIGPASLIYTRTIDGSKILLKARMNSFSAGFGHRSARGSYWR